MSLRDIYRHESRESLILAHDNHRERARVLIADGHPELAELSINFANTILKELIDRGEIPSEMAVINE